MDEELFIRRVKAMRNIAASYLDAHNRANTQPDTLPPGEVMRKAQLLKQSLETVYSDLMEYMKSLD